MPRPEAPPSSRYAPWLYLALGLFVLRVLAQPLALILPAGTLPSFESWHSGALPYPLLVAAQIAILAWLCLTAWRVARGAVRPHRKRGKLWIAAACVYGGAMGLRLLLGATVFEDIRWFASPLPTVFHFVLAGYLFAYGRFHVRGAPGASSMAP